VCAIDASGNHLIKVRVPVLRPGMLCAFEDELDHVVN